MNRAAEKQGHWKRGSAEPPSLALGSFAAQLLVALQREFPLNGDVEIEWRNLRVTAGRAAYESNSIVMSAMLLIDEERVASTLKHEYAHLLAFSRFGRKGVGHGHAWRQAMHDLGEPPTVRHRYEVVRNAKRQIVVYECRKCAARFERRRRLPKRGKYVHADCGGALDCVGVEAREAA